MPSFAEVARVLRMYRGRYESLDAFVDDIDELRTQILWPELRVVQSSPRPLLETWVEGDRLTIEVFSDQGIARFRLVGPGSAPNSGETIGAGAALGGALGAALGAASEKKEGLLGGMVLGILVGGLIGAAAAPDRALALQFDPALASWRVYDGPLLTWAKRALIPT